MRGCAAASQSVVSVYWAEIVGARRYILLRDNQQVYSGTDAFAEDNGIVAGGTYAYTVKFENANGNPSVASEPTSYVVNTASGSEFLCGGVKGFVRLKTYDNQQTRQWRIAPSPPAIIALNVRAT